MNIVNLERALTAYLAGIAGLTVDTTCFRGLMPGDKINAIGVKIDAGTRGNTPTAFPISAQMLGRYISRDEALTLADRIDQALPVYGATITHDEETAKVTIQKASSVMVYPSTLNGKDIWGISANLQIAIKG